jgi:hypothetical protein
MIKPKYFGAINNLSGASGIRRSTCRMIAAVIVRCVSARILLLNPSFEGLT